MYKIISARRTSHPDTSIRTQKLSFAAPKVLVGWPAGRIGRCHIIFLDSSAAGQPYRFPPKRQQQGQALAEDSKRKFVSLNFPKIFLDSSAAEHPAVNRRVVGSNPTRGAIYVDRNYWFGQKRVKNACFWLFFYMFFGIFEDFSKVKIYKLTMPFSLLIFGVFWEKQGLNLQHLYFLTFLRRFALHFSTNLKNFFRIF